MRFRKLLAMLLALTLILGISAPFAQGVLAEPASDEEVGWADIDGFAIVIADETLNLRAEPSTSAERIAQMPRGAVVIVVEWGNPWSLVIYAEQTSATEMEVFAGFAMSEYLSLYEEPVEVPDEPGWSGEEVTATVIAEKSLYLREEPSTSARVTATMLRGETVSVVERGDTWSLVIYLEEVNDTQFDVHIGYCMNEFLQFSDESTEDPSQPEDPNWPDTDEATAIVIAENSLNLRTQPVSSATVVTRIPRGATVTVLSKGETWSQVRYGSQSGYCMNEFLQFSDGGSTEAPDDPDWSDGEGTATVIAENSLNLRTQPASSATVVTRIPRGATVTVLSKGETWSQVRYGSQSGYCMNEFLRFEGDPVEPEQPGDDSDEPGWADIEGEATVIAENSLNLRTQPASSATVVARIPRGATVTVLERGDTWSFVYYGNKTGYCMNEFLSFVDAA